VGGPCLTKDPYYLLDGIDTSQSDIITTSRAINDQMPEHVVTLVLRALMTVGKDVAKSRISILGVTYKKDTDDSRNSPSEPIIRSLVALHSKVVVFDPCCVNESFGAKQAQSLFEAITGSDCIVIVTDHSEFINMDLQKIKPLMKNKPIIVDSRRIIDPDYAEKAGFYYYGIGRGKQ
jgi:nucleotide sugar dehydrogenase